MCEAGENERLRGFIKRFKAEALRIEATGENALLMAAHADIRRGTATWDKNNRKSCHNMKAFHERMADYIGMKEAKLDCKRSIDGYLWNQQTSPTCDRRS